MRVFVGIKASEEVKDACAAFAGELAGLHGKMVPRDDLHITILPPLQMEDLNATEETVRHAVAHVGPFVVSCERLTYGPPGSGVPRLAWIECAPSPELTALKQKLHEAFGIQDPRGHFLPHITVARFSEDDAPRLAAHPIERSLPLTTPVASVELFESPAGGGPGYKILASFPLKD